MASNIENPYTSRATYIRGLPVEYGYPGSSEEIEIEKDNLEIWLADETWHPGREDIPRQVKDDLAMNRRGDPVEWFDKFGNPTIAKTWEEE